MNVVNSFESFINFELPAKDVLPCKHFTELFQECFTESGIKIFGNAVECAQIPNTHHQGESTL